MKKTSFGIKNYDKNQSNPFVFRSAATVSKYAVVQLNKDQLSKVFNLSRTALKLLFYCINNYNQYNNTVYFNLKESKACLGFNGKRSIYNALTELLGEKIIARANNENTYYLNDGIITVFNAQMN